MKKLITILLLFFTCTVVFSQTDSLVGDTHYIPFPTGVVSTATTVNYIYKIPYYSQWSWEYYQAKLAGRSVHDSMSFQIFACTGPPFWTWQAYPGLVKKVEKRSADTVTFDDPLGTALPYIKLVVKHYATDTALIKTNRLIFKRTR